MTLIKIILAFFILPFVDVTVYVYNTVDSPSVELYDCILHESLFYCRRPTEPMALNRSNSTTQCYHNGSVHSFSRLRKNNVSISTVLHKWKSSIEKAEQYSRYTKNSSEVDGYVCECRDPQSFGKNCEYLLPMGTTFAQTATVETALKSENPAYVQIYGDIICYITLECNSGLLCLDWREICDDVQQCMAGLDEENCDILEFNECENDEYRCMNGMCIPEEYFLDGEFDCLDWSDEIQYYDDANCPIEGVSARCDDRICPPNQYSCSDGQCILNRFDFQIMSQIKRECRSRRDQYFICETHYVKGMWTLPSGRCYLEGKYDEDPILSNGTSLEECLYFLRCDLSEAKEKDCPCGYTECCPEELNATCPSNHVQYPKAGIMAPYILFFYPNHYQLRPEFMQINGTIKCDGILIDIPSMNFQFNPELRQVEHDLCQWAKNNSLLDNHDPSQHFYQHSLTFNNRSYSLTDVCNNSKQFISTYRVKDGFENCVDKMDETAHISISTICSKMQRYRFRCSADQPTCLSVTALGDLHNDCNNTFDELWLGTSTKLADIKCNDVWKDQCEILREYIAKSWVLKNPSEVAEQFRIPFRHYCDTVWNLASKEDENANECREWWVCPDEQWQCDTGQCIEGNWVLDGEWDCSDASDEENLNDQSIEDRNLQVVPLNILKNRSDDLSNAKPFSTICNLTTEFPCFPVNVTNLLTNLSYDRPCIDKHKIGDDHIDCYGAIDERNTITHCNHPTMLGYNFKCGSVDRCIPYWNYCYGDRCDTASDDLAMRELRKNSDDCDRISDSRCFNGTCVVTGRCNRIIDCSFGEDEYMCEYKDISTLADVFYRKEKEARIKNTEQKLQFNRFPPDSNTTTPTVNLTSTTLTTRAITKSLDNISLIASWCNRGIGVQMYNGSIVCFCPPQYYGDKCQFHSDRIIVLLHLNLSQSVYTTNSDINIELKMVILFLFDHEIVMNHVFHVRPATEFFVYTKKMVHFLYSRSLRFLQHKRQRYFNHSDIVSNHPYAVRIEMYERKHSEEPLLNAVWQYPMYFDYLPVFRFAKTLRLTKPDMEQNPCTNNPCNQNQECQPLINDKSKYICLCKGNFTGENCLIEDEQCTNGYCSSGSICKPNYRGLVIGNKLPYCICRFDHFGERCDIKYDQCLLTPCQNNGTCYSTAESDVITCLCTSEYHGKNCELRKPHMKLYINESVNHAAAVVQYFDIDLTSLNLILVHQEVHRTLPKSLEYRHQRITSPQITLVKLYSAPVDDPVQLYLISLHINTTSIYAITQVIEKTQCVEFRTLISSNDTQDISNYSPIKYHYLCRNDTNLFCFRDNFYLCICGENHTRVECFRYDYTLDQCFQCLAGGRCLKGDRFQSNAFICLCPPCRSGIYCQLNSNSFVFTLDQLFYIDLISTKQIIVVYSLIISSMLLALIALLNNVFSFLTFRRQKCLCNGVGHYLFYMSIINQISLSLLVARLIHISVIVTGLQSHPIVDNILCKVLSYLLTCFTRLAYWLISFVAIERVYTTVFVKGQWLKKPYVARRLIASIFFIVFFSGAYELVFVKLFVFDNGDNSSMCVIEFSTTHQSTWMLIHQIVSIAHSILPLLINLFCTITIIYAIINSKMNVHKPKRRKLLLCILTIL